MSKWCGDENCLQCADKDPDPYVHLPREDYNALRDERDRLRKALEDIRDSIGNGALNVYWIKRYAEAALTPEATAK